MAHHLAAEHTPTSAGLPRQTPAATEVPVDFDTQVKLQIYDMVARTGGVPSTLDVARTIAVPLDDVVPGHLSPVAA